jgi:peroxiredoxin Q/BCP
VEGRALRDRADAFDAADCIVLGASFDTPEENRAFAEDPHYGFRRLSDVDRTVGTGYEVARPPGDQYASFPARVSYLIDPDGVIRRSYAVADVKTHADDVLADLAALQG